MQIHTDVHDGANLAQAAIFASALQPAGDPAQCSIFGCADRARLRLNGRGACGHLHLAMLLSSEVLAERALAAGTVLRPAQSLPLGAILLRRGCITEPELAEALQAQQRTGSGRLGDWLRQQSGLAEAALAEALAAQANCAVLSLDEYRPIEAAHCLPRLLMERLGAIPFSLSGSPRRMILAFEGRSNPALLAAARRVHGFAVSCGVLPGRAFWEAAREHLSLRLPPVLECEAPSLGTAAEAVSRLLTHAGAREVSFAALRDCLWLRFSSGTGDLPRHLLCTLAASSYSDAPEREDCAGAARLTAALVGQLG